MFSIKRKAPESQLHRRVRARREESEELEDIEDSVSENSKDAASENESQSEEEKRSDDGSDSDTSPVSEQDESSAEDEKDEDPLANISFGALAKAQESLLNPKKSSSSSKKTGDDDTWTNNEAAERKAGRAARRDFTATRTNKHAPTEVSSKIAVSRRREIIALPKVEARDPRFLPLSGPLNPDKTKKAYSFLDKYRDDEMAELKKAVKEAEDAGSKEKIKQALRVMESRKKTQMRKDKEQEVMARHMKEEKEKVKVGKKPFYLKKAELHKKFLVDEFKGMNGSKLDRAIERRRKKLASKEKKNLPWERRKVGD